MSSFFLNSSAMLQFPDLIPPAAEGQLMLSQNLDQDYYELQAIIGMKKIRGKMFYKVKWAGYPLEQATWQPSQNLSYASEQIKLWYDQTLKKDQEKKNANQVKTVESAISLKDNLLSDMFPLKRILHDDVQNYLSKSSKYQTEQPNKQDQSQYQITNSEKDKKIIKPSTRSKTHIQKPSPPLEQNKLTIVSKHKSPRIQTQPITSSEITQSQSSFLPRKKRKYNSLGLQCSSQKIFESQTKNHQQKNIQADPIVTSEFDQNKDVQKVNENIQQPIKTQKSQIKRIMTILEKNEQKHQYLVQYANEGIKILTSKQMIANHSEQFILYLEKRIYKSNQRI